MVFFSVDGPLNLKRQCMIKIRKMLAPSLVDQLPLPEGLKQEVKRVPTVCCEFQQSTTSVQSPNKSLTNSTNTENCEKSNKTQGQSLDILSQDKTSSFSAKVEKT